MKTITKLVIAAFAATTCIPAAVMAAAQETKNQGYLVDNNGSSAIVTSGTGLCWHNSEWTAARGSEPCDMNNAKPVAAATPAPVVVTAAPIAAAAPQPLPQKFSFSGDALFAFDKSTLKPEGKEMLNGLVAKLNGATYDTISATGHTDRIGNNDYNQKLSERRAQAVKDYLVSKDIQASRIVAEGKGEMQPVTKAGDCKGEKSAKVEACLQADRRVDVELTGGKTVVGAL